MKEKMKQYRHFLRRLHLRRKTMIDWHCQFCGTRSHAPFHAAACPLRQLLRLPEKEDVLHGNAF